MAAQLYDRHETLAGVSGANPLLVPRNLAANAMNRWMRYDRNSNRAPFQNLRLNFETNEARIWFQGGNIQGAYFYNSYPSFLDPYLIVSIAGRIFKIQIKGRDANVTTLFQGNEPVLTHAWFAQGFEWLVVQNGLDKPILWDGITARRAVDNEVPVGSVMATIHGRLVVASADGTNQIAVGDIVYGETQTSTIDIIKFTETQYWAEGGAFGAPVYVGDLMGMAAMPYLDTGTGQNELVILGTEGAVSMDLSRPREQWKDSQLLRISLIGGGCASSHSLATLNGDLFFRSAEGIRSYRNARSEFNQSWNQSPISTDVRRWIDYDAPDLLQYNSQVSWNNLLLSTCYPRLQGPNNLYAGFHRYHEGFVVMDCQPESNTVRAGSPIWQGMWTGIRPVCFVEGRIENNNRCFAFSYDRDGKNRLYEIVKEGFDTFEGERRKMFSFYDTPAFGTIERTTSNFENKQINGGELELSRFQEEVDIELSLKPDNSPCFVPHGEFTVGCDCVATECFTTTRPKQARIIFSNLSGKCDPSTNREIMYCHHWQGRVRMTGSLSVECLAYRFEVKTQPTACEVIQGNCEPITCCPDSDIFSYHLAPEGDNTEQPNIPVPSDAPVLYNSTQSFTARCAPPSQGQDVTVTEFGSSYISQAEADAIALNKARTQAFALLQCSTCNTAELVSFVANNETVDLSIYFTTEYQNLANRPWRLIDEETLAIIASGVVDSSGILVVSNAIQTGDNTFDPATFIFEDTSGTDTPMALQIGCPGPNGESWPGIPDPY